METIELMPARVRIASILKKAIYAGEYKSGQELSLTDVAAQLGVSRTPVREAFQELAFEGLITLRMNKGAIVNDIDEKFIRDSFEMRILLEGEAAACAAVNGMETEKLLKELAVMKENIDETQRDQYTDLNSRIHMSIWKAADNQKLTSFLMELWNGPSTIHSTPAAKVHYRKSTEEHIAILNAIQKGDAADARREMEQHIRRSMENILALKGELKD